MKEITRTELVWAGKYDDQGNLRPVERTILPFQVVETVNESKADREKVQRDLWTLMPRDETWRNMLIWGDNKVVMSSLLPRFAGKVNLIYIDPPFATGQDFSFRVRVGDEEFVKEPSIIEEKAYRDTWGRGLDSYLQMMYERLVLMRELLAEDGSIFVHVDPNVGPSIKLLLTEIFGADRSVSEIIWKRIYTHSDTRGFGVVHDNIFWYSKSGTFKWNVQHEPHTQDYLTSHYTQVDADGRRYQLISCTAKGSGPPRRFGDKLLSPPAGTHWKWKQETIDRLMVEGQIVFTSGGTPRLKRYLDEAPGRVIQSIWTDVYPVNSQAIERVNYDTQKPEALLERILKASSNEGDIVADFFCGSGTTLAVAEKLGRRWIGCDLSKWAIQVTRKRLLQIEGCKPFDLLNLGNYERHKLAANGQWERYVQFILELYRAEPVTGFQTLHGKKARACIHVGSVDSPVTMREIRQTLQEAQEAGVREVHFLGWDFEMGLHDLVHQVGEDHGVKVRLVSIPREALEVTNPAREEVRFFDLNYLELEHEVSGRKLTVRLKDFIIANPEYLPDEVQARIKKFTDYIDYWAVDWDYQDDTFHNGWQSFRTRKDPKLETKVTHTYDQPGTYKVLVKVVDIFGNDTTKMVEVRI
ncbi:MAG: site-specific DNA-methyltransferase [Deltaproteobacteria bacterium]|nr:site-specific DNA-methyltransferase [Deltaproteobacteria bacterium]